jgi:hypothetical protein
MTLHNTSYFVRASLLVLGTWCLGSPVVAADTQPDALIAHYQQLAGQKADRVRGQKFFNAKAANDLSCASCHGASPVLSGKHASTGKTIAPLAPSVNPERFSDSAKVEKWFRRNCKDVLSRECTALEKADVVAYLKDLK